MPYALDYAMSKAAVIEITRGLARELSWLDADRYCRVCDRASNPRCGRLEQFALDWIEWSWIPGTVVRVAPLPAYQWKIRGRRF